MQVVQTLSDQAGKYGMSYSAFRCLETERWAERAAIKTRLNLIREDLTLLYTHQALN